MPLRTRGISNVSRMWSISVQLKAAWKCSPAATLRLVVRCRLARSRSRLLACGDLAAGGQVPLGEVAFAPAVIIQIDGETEGGVAGIDGAADAVFDRGHVVAHVELIDFRRVGLGGDLVEPRLGRGAEDTDGAEGGRRASRRQRPIGGEVLQRADRRQQHRQAELVAQQFAATIDLRDVAQHPRPKGDGIQRQSVALVGRLGFGRAHQIVPMLGRQGGARRRHEFMEDQDFGIVSHGRGPRGRSPRRGRRTGSRPDRSRCRR
jgi:hypothetical protein